MSSKKQAKKAKASDALDNTDEVTSTGVGTCTKKITLIVAPTKRNVVLFGEEEVPPIKCIFEGRVEGDKFKGMAKLTWTGDVEVRSVASRKGPQAKSGDPFSLEKTHRYLYVKSTATLTLEVSAPGWTVDRSQASATITVSATSVTIVNEHDGSPAAATILGGKTRKYKALITPPADVSRYAWTRSEGEKLFAITPFNEQVTTATAGASAGGDAEIEVTAVIQLRERTSKHKIKIVSVAIGNAADDGSPATSIAPGLKDKFKAVLTPSDAGGTFVWSKEGEQLTLGENTTDQIVEVSGGTAAAGQKLTVTYTLADQSVEESITLAVKEVSLVPVVAVVAIRDRAAGTVAKIAAAGAPGDARFAWVVGENTIDAAAEGGTTASSLSVKSKKAGVASVTLTWTPPDEDGRELEGAAVFIDLWLTGFTSETATATTLTSASAASNKKTELLIGLPDDPPAWKLGELLVSATGAPAAIDTCGVQADGAYSWKLGTYTRAAAVQPTNHGADSAKIKLAALPKTADNKGPSSAVTETIEATYTLHDVAAKDKLSVTVHPYGCSQVHWQRKGKNAVTAADRPVPCGHNAAPPSRGFTNAREPSNDTGVDFLDPRGHQHGGICTRCSNDDARTIYHYVELSHRTLAEARALAAALVAYVKDGTKTPRFNALLTKAAKEHLTGGKMLGVLVGVGGDGRDKWLYALSAAWPASVGWCAPIGLDKRTIDTIARSRPSTAPASSSRTPMRRSTSRPSATASESSAAAPRRSCSIRRAPSGSRISNWPKCGSSPERRHSPKRRPASNAAGSSAACCAR